MHSRGEGVGEKTESDGCLKGEYKGSDVGSEQNGEPHFYVCQCVCVCDIKITKIKLNK